ncbi:hypothetical protein ACVBIO_01115 [Shewanella sp. 0m-8]
MMKENLDDTINDIKPLEWFKAFDVTVEKLAYFSGLSNSSLIGLSDKASAERLSRIQSILKRIQYWFDDEHQAWEWFISKRIPSFGDLTPSEVVREFGDAGIHSLLEYIEHKEIGGFE